MGDVRVVLAVVTGLLLLGGGARAQQPFENPELADVQAAFFSHYGKSGVSAVIATMGGGYGNSFARFHGYRYATTKNGAQGVLAFDLYEPDEIKRSGAGSWQVKQTDFVQMAFWLSTPYGHGFTNASPYSTFLTPFYTYNGGSIPMGLPMNFPGSPVSAQIQGCNASIATKDKDRDGLPDSASWKAACNPKALGWLSSDDQKLYKKVLKGLKGKGDLFGLPERLY